MIGEWSLFLFSGGVAFSAFSDIANVIFLCSWHIIGILRFRKYDIHGLSISSSSLFVRRLSGVAGWLCNDVVFAFFVGSDAFAFFDVSVRVFDRCSIVWPVRVVVLIVWQLEFLLIVVICTFLFFGQTPRLNDAVKQTIRIVVFTFDFVSFDKHAFKVFSVSSAGFSFSQIVINVFSLFDYTNKFEFGHYYETNCT